LLSVVIPALNSASTISHTLSSIFSNKSPEVLFEVLVIDDGSSDNTVQIAKEYPAKVYHCPIRGIGPPRNLGIKMARGEIVCFTDSDCVVEDDWLERIANFFKKNPNADGVGGPVFPDPHYQNKIQKLTGELFVEDQAYPKKTKKVRFGSLSGIIFGSNSAYRKKILVSEGLFCEPGGSNLELSWRLARKGHQLFFDPSIKVYHIFPWKLTGIAKQQFRWGLQLMHMNKINRLNKGKTEELVLISYFLARRLFELITFQSLDRKMLHFFQLASFSLGQIYGYREW